MVTELDCHSTVRVLGSICTVTRMVRSPAIAPLPATPDLPHGRLGDAGVIFVELRVCPPEAFCSDCHQPLFLAGGPPDGWQLEDGRTVCHACCIRSTRLELSRCVRRLPRLLRRLLLALLRCGRTPGVFL